MNVAKITKVNIIIPQFLAHVNVTKIIKVSIVIAQFHSHINVAKITKVTLHLIFAAIKVVKMITRVKIISNDIFNY